MRWLWQASVKFACKKDQYRVGLEFNAPLDITLWHWFQRSFQSHLLWHSISQELSLAYSTTLASPHGAKDQEPLVDLIQPIWLTVCLLAKLGSSTKLVHVAAALLVHGDLANIVHFKNKHADEIKSDSVCCKKFTAWKLVTIYNYSQNSTYTCHAHTHLCYSSVKTINTTNKNTLPQRTYSYS